VAQLEGGSTVAGYTILHAGLRNFSLNGNININSGGYVQIGGDPNGNAKIELGDSTHSGKSPFIDFHYGTGSAQDFNVRIINEGDNQLAIEFAGAGKTSISGNVGINVDAHATYKLDVGGDAQIQGWLRTTGSYGWYSESYGGGWQMTDSTYIRNYGSKQLLMNANVNFSSTNGLGIKFWNDDQYKIYMSSTADATWGGKLNTNGDYNMYFRMTGGTNRGWAFKNGSTVVAEIAGDGTFRAARMVIPVGTDMYATQ
jgi:hypothetical protein